MGILERTAKNKKFLWNPPNFDPEKVLPDDLKKYAKYARLFVHIVTVRSTMDSRVKFGEYANLKAEYLRDNFPRKIFKPLKKALIDAGVIDCDNHYKKGEKSLGYRINEAYSTQIDRLETDDPEIIGRLETIRNNSVLPENKTHRHIYNCLKKIEIVGDPETIDYRHRLSFLRIRHKEFFLIPDEYGRVHTNITNLKRELRSYLRVEGKSLVNIDVRNSQPLVFAAFMKENGFSSPDGAELTKRCERGKFYDHLMELANISPECRDDFKIEFFKDVFYGPNESTTPNWKIFEKCYPQVAKFIWNYKKGRNKKYAELARNLQRIESNIVIDGIIEECRSQHIDVWVSTIHDSVLTLPEHADVVKKVIFAHFNKAGLNPTVKEEYYDSV